MLMTLTYGSRTERAAAQIPIAAVAVVAHAVVQLLQIVWALWRRAAGAALAAAGPMRRRPLCGGQRRRPYAVHGRVLGELCVNSEN